MPATRLPPDAAPESTLLGRDTQLSGVARAVARVRTGRAQFVFIEGESGFGKTALLREAVASVPLWPLRAAVADENETELPYGVLNQLLAEVDEPEKLEPLLAGGVPPDVPPMVAGAALLALIAGSEGATCVTIDDAQWMDQHSAEALWFAGRRSFRDRLLVIIAARPDETAFLERVRRLVADDERGIRLSVGGLSVDDVATLIRWRTGPPAPRRLAARLAAATDGNALHVQTILNSAVSGPDPLGALERLLAGTPPAAPGFRAVTRQTLDQISPSARTVLECVAVLNDASTITDVSAVAARYGHPFDSADLDEALTTGLLTLSADTSSISIPHQRVRSVIAGDLSLQATRELHAAAGAVIGGHRGLVHRVHAAAGPDDALAAELDETAALASANHEVERAFRYARWAASLSRRPADKERRTIDAGVYALSARRIGVLTQAVDDFRNLQAGPEREVLLGNTALANADVAACRTHLLRATVDGPTASPRATLMRASAHETLAQLALAAEDFGECLRHCDDALGQIDELRSQSPHPPAPAELDIDEMEGSLVCWRALAVWQSGGSEEGQDRLDDLIAEARVRGLRPQHAVLFLTRGNLRRQQSRLAEAVSDLEDGIALADLGRPELAPYGRIELALTRFRKGEWDAAAATAAGAASLADDVQNPWLRAAAYAIAAMVPAARGNRPAANAWLAEVEVMTAPLQSAVFRRLVTLVRVLEARSSGDKARVIGLTRQAIAREPVNAQIEHGWWRELLDEALTSEPPAPVHDPLAVLSSREREVAHLAAQGLTNREVAQRLFVSVKGVEYHMGNVLAKLGLASRRGIRTLIERNSATREEN